MLHCCFDVDVRATPGAGLSNDDNHDNVTITFCFDGQRPVYLYAIIEPTAGAPSVEEVPVASDY